MLKLVSGYVVLTDVAYKFECINLVLCSECVVKEFYINELEKVKHIIAQIETDEDVKNF